MASASPAASAAVVRRRRREVHRTRLLGDAHVEHHVALRAPASTVGLPVSSTIGTPSRLSGGRIASTSSVSPEFDSAEHHVAARHHAEVAVHALGGVQEVRGRAGRGERRGDLAADDARTCPCR